MTILYINTHNVTGLKYFGKTTLIDFHKYKGSGKYWTRHIKKHGYNVTTQFYAQFDEQDHIERILLEGCALMFSYENDIVQSRDWANMKPENGLDGGLKGVEPWNKGKFNIYSLKTLASMSLAAKNRPEDSDETRFKKGTSLRGKNNPIPGKLTVRNKISKTLTHSNRFIIIGFGAPEGEFSKKEIKLINQSLRKTNKLNPLGNTIRSRITLNINKKLNQIGWYVIEIMNQ